MKFLSVVKPPSIYHGCSTRNKFWEEKFTGRQDFFQSVKMKHCGRRKVRKHKEIRGSDKCVARNISKEIIVHKPLSENLSMDVSESECNIVHETLSQNNSSDVTTTLP